MPKHGFAGLAAALFLVACGADTENKTATSAESTPAAEVVNVYSSRHYDTDLALYDGFTAATGIEVNRIEAGADELIARIQAEGEFSPADVLITVDAGRLWRGEEAGIFSPVESDVLNSRIPGYAAIEHVGLDRAEDTGLFPAPKAPGIDRNQHVGRAELAFGLDARNQLVGAGLDTIDLDARRGRESVVKRQIRVVMPR